MMFSLPNFFKTTPSSEAPTTYWTVQQTTSSIRCNATPTASVIVTRTIAPNRKGQVKYQGSWWTARCNSGAMLLVGETVQIMHRQDLTLYVEPLPCSVVTLQQTTLLHYQSTAEHVFL